MYVCVCVYGVAQHAFRFFAVFTSLNCDHANMWESNGRGSAGLNCVAEGLSSEVSLQTAWRHLLLSISQPKQMHLEASTGAGICYCCSGWDTHEKEKPLVTIDQPFYFMTWLFMTLDDFSYVILVILIKWPRRLPQWRRLSGTTCWTLEAWTGGGLMRPSEGHQRREEREKWTARQLWRCCEGQLDALFWLVWFKRV